MRPGRIRRYSDLTELGTFEERFRYLSLEGRSAGIHSALTDI